MSGSEVRRRGEQERASELRVVISRSDRSEILELIASGTPLSETLDALLVFIERAIPEMLCSILPADPDGFHLRHGAAPSKDLRDREARDSQEHYRLLNLATNDAVWDWDVRTNRIWWNDAVERLFGYPRQKSARTTLGGSSAFTPRIESGCIRACSAQSAKGEQQPVARHAGARQRSPSTRSARAARSTLPRWAHARAAVWRATRSALRHA